MPVESNLLPTLAGVVWSTAAVVVASGVVVWISVRQGSDRTRTANRVLAVWLVAALAAVAYLTLQSGPNGLANARPSIFNPISKLDRNDAAANVLLYVPVGFFAALLWRSRMHAVAWATAFAFGVSSLIEFAQWVLPIDRAATTHDVLSNTLGGFVGAAIGALVARFARDRQRSAGPQESDAQAP